MFSYNCYEKSVKIKQIVATFEESILPKTSSVCGTR